MAAALPMAEALGGADFDTRRLLMLHNAVGGPGGSASIRKLWPALKADLQRIAMKGVKATRPAEMAESTLDAPAALKGMAPRNAKFLEWYGTCGSDTYHSHAKIRDKWNGLSLQEREKICPGGPQMIKRGEQGRQTVIKATGRAKKAMVEKLPKRRKKPVGKRRP